MKRLFNAIRAAMLGGLLVLGTVPTSQAQQTGDTAADQLDAWLANMRQQEALAKLQDDEKLLTMLEATGAFSPIAIPILLFFSIFPAQAAARRKRSWLGWYVLSVFISPLLAYILLRIMPSRPDPLAAMTVAIPAPLEPIITDPPAPPPAPPPPPPPPPPQPTDFLIWALPVLICTLIAAIGLFATYSSSSSFSSSPQVLPTPPNGNWAYTARCQSGDHDACLAMEAQAIKRNIQ
jgi:hypothetical protein